VPTYEHRLTHIASVTLKHIDVGKTGYLCKIDDQAELPVQNIRLVDVKAGSLSEEAIQNKTLSDLRFRSQAVIEMVIRKLRFQ